MTLCLVLPFPTLRHYCRSCFRTNVAIEVSTLRCPDCHEDRGDAA